MKVVFLVGVFAAQFAFGTNVVPDAFPETRYEKLVEQWPFAVATAPKVEVPETPVENFGTNLYIIGVAKTIKEGKEDWFVTIKSRAEQQDSFSLMGTEQSHDGIQLESVDFSERIGMTQVTLKKGTEFAKIKFDEATMNQTAMAAPNPAGGGAPRAGRQPVNGAMARPNAIGRPAASIPRPGANVQRQQVRPPNLPRPGQINVQSGAQQQGGPQQENRRRVRLPQGPQSPPASLGN